MERPTGWGSSTVVQYQDQVEFWNNQNLQDSMMAESIVIQTEEDQLEHENAVVRVCIDEDAQVVNQNTADRVESGSVLINQLEGLVRISEMLYRAAEVARKENTNLVTVGYTLAGGISSFIAGNPITGIVLTGAAVDQIRNILQRSGIKTKDAIGEIRKGIELIQEMEKAQGKSLDIIGDQVKIASEKADEIEIQMNKIQELATKGILDGEKKKKIAYDCSKDAHWAYVEAKNDLEKSRNEILTIQENFKIVVERLEKLIGTSEKELTVEEMKEFIEETKKILEEMKVVQENINQNSVRSNEGMKKLLRAFELNIKAAVAHQQVYISVQDALHQIQQNASLKEVAGAKSALNKAAGEVKDAKKVNEAAQNLLEQNQEKLKKLQEEQESQWGTRTIIVATMAATTAGAFGWIATAVPAALVAGQAFHEGRRTRRYIQEHSRQRANEIRLDRAAGQRALNSPRAEFDAVSSGFGGWARGRPSTTVGNIVVDMRDSELTYRFNRKLNNVNGKAMSDEDLLKLNNDLLKRLNTGILSPEECLKILAGLAEKVIDNSEGKETIQCVNEESPIFTLLRLECSRRIKEDETGEKEKEREKDIQKIEGEFEEL